MGAIKLRSRMRSAETHELPDSFHWMFEIFSEQTENSITNIQKVEKEVSCQTVYVIHFSIYHQKLK